MSTCKHSLLTLLTGIALIGQAVYAGEIYKQVDEKGHVTYSNKPIKGGKKVDLPELTTVQLPKVENAKPAVKGAEESTKTARQDDLRAEIVKEEKALADAKQAYKEGADKPEVWHHTKTVTGADGKTKQVTESGRNVVAYEEKMKKLQQEVDIHEKRLQQLKTELSNLEPKKDEKK